MPTHFKLRFDDLTRRASFPNQPAWNELAAKISALYSIPQELVGVTYIDPEDEEITLNTEEELQDYYHSSYLPGEPIKFAVRNLPSRNRQPSSSNVRNTFGQFVGLDDITGVDDWQSVNNIPPLDDILGLTSPASNVRSAFVETVSERSSVTKDAPVRDDGDAASHISEPYIPREDKGKGKADSLLSLLSTQSVLAEDDGDKPPVHVYDVSSQNRSAAAPAFSLSQTSAPIAAESTPRAQTQNLDNHEPPVLEEQPPKPQEFDDPPLPTFDSAPQPTPHSASLARDVASFLNMITNIVSTHPEIGDALRNIARNTTNGAYWTAHREALSQAAAEFQRSTEALAEEGRRVVEEDAGRRVAEALAGVLRIFSQTQATVQSPPVPSNPGADNKTSGPNAQPQTPPMPGGFPSGFYPTLGRNFSLDSRYTWRTSMPVPPNLATGWPAPPRSSPFAPGALNATNIPSASPAQPPHNVSIAPADPDPVHATHPDQLNSEGVMGNRTGEPPSPQEMKARVEAAKKAYKAEKERYRQQREEKRKEREKMPKGEDTLNTSQMANPAKSPETAHIVSNARDGFPQFEMVSISGTLPQRHNTHLGHFPRRHDKSGGDLFTRAVNRISRRLSDMGFTEQAYPDLTEKIKAELPSDGAVSKDREDDIVTTLLERMLAAPKTPAASGSGLKDIPGGWH